MERIALSSPQLNMGNASNPCVERLLALGEVILYSKGFQPCFQINCHSELDSESYQFVRFLNNIFNYSYVLFFFLSDEARKKKSTKRKKKHVLRILASSVLTELGNTKSSSSKEQARWATARRALCLRQTGGKLCYP